MGKKAITTRDDEETKQPNLAQCYRNPPPNLKPRFGYSSDPPPKRPELPADVVANHIREQTISTANAALAYYNKKNSTHFELVDPIYSIGSLRSSALWFHCNFTAKDHGDSSVKLFFAEMKANGCECGITNYLVTACRVLEGTKTLTGCEMCGKLLLHPTRGFREGLHRLQHRSLRPRRDGKVFKK